MVCEAMLVNGWKLIYVMENRMRQLMVLNVTHQH